MVIEICITHLPAAITAQRLGARRIELCSALDAGGVTPSAGLIRQAVAALDIPVMVLIRPREGDFIYTPVEVEAMLDDIRFCHSAGAHGVVIGALNGDFELDMPVMEKMVEAANGLEICCHRAFDFVQNPEKALEQLVTLGIDRILTSGGAPSAWQGRSLIRQLVEQANGRISIMPGGGINSSNLKALAEATGTKEFHLSAKKRTTTPSNKDGLAGLDFEYWTVDEAELSKI